MCVCANVYRVYMYAYTHMSTCPSPPVDVVGVGGRWGCGGWGGNPPYHMGGEGGGREHETYIYIYIYI